MSQLGVSHSEQSHAAFVTTKLCFVESAIAASQTAFPIDGSRAQSS
jgi:hypothetical protein